MQITLLVIINSLWVIAFLLMVNTIKKYKKVIDLQEETIETQKNIIEINLTTILTQEEILKEKAS